MRSERGSIRELANSLNVTSPAVTSWLKGSFKSARIEAAVRAWAAERNGNHES